MTRLAHTSSKQTIDPSLPRHESLVHMWRAAVEGYPNVTAVIYEDRRINYREFGRAIQGLTGELESLGLRGKRVVLLMPNSIEMDIALMAVMTGGAQVAPANPYFKVPELERALKSVQAGAIISDQSTFEKAEQVAAALGIPVHRSFKPGDLDISAWRADSALDRAPERYPAGDDPALIIFTGGSTGIPKGVDHTHGALMWGLLQHVSVWPLEFGTEIFLNAAPMFHIWGLSYASWVPIFTAGTLVMMPRYDAGEVVRALDRHKVTVFAGGPAPIYMGLLAVPDFDDADLGALKYCPTGGAPCPEDLHREWLDRTGCPLLEGWGMSEGAPFCLNPKHDRRSQSVGRPVPETELEIVDVETGTQVLAIGEAGEARVRGPQMMTEYVANPEETAAALRDGWMYTGDIGYVDEEGYVCLVDRKKDMVLVGGYNVYPREVDEVLFNHPKIREAATVGRPDKRLGEVVAAFVVLDHGQSMTPGEFDAYCAESMVKYKRPVDVFFVDAIPRTRANKIDRVALRTMLAERPHTGG
jgi:long-chain acyl-CoA synthetase